MTAKSKNFKIVYVLIQVFIWLIIALFPVLSFSTTPVVMFKSISTIILLAGLFYLNMYWLIPSFLFKKKMWIYIFLLFALVVLIMLLNGIYDKIFDFENLILRNPPQVARNQPPKMGITFRNMPIIFFSILAIAISVSYKAINEYIKKEQENKEFVNQKLNAELAMLKSQINPHFLFNILNDICSLALKKSNDTANAIIKLSDLMRYMIYDSSSVKVELEKELKYIENYINLQKIRIADSVKIDYMVNADNMEKQIAPLLLIPFIENAFKHGISYAYDARIIIQINTKANFLSLFVKNNKYSTNESIQHDDSGIGLENVRKQLELLYPQNYKLTINDTEKFYTVELELTLDSW